MYCFYLKNQDIFTNFFATIYNFCAKIIHGRVFFAIFVLIWKTGKTNWERLLASHHRMSHKGSTTSLTAHGKAMVNIVLERKGRAGKQATIITDLLADDEAVKDLARALKQHCGTGGSARGGEILLQGDFRNKALQWLQQQGFKARII